MMYSIDGNSDVERKFKQKKAIKRNKKIFDVDLLTTIQIKEEKERRKPGSTFSEQADDKFRESFMDSTTAFSHRREEDIDKYRQRYSSGGFLKAKTQSTSAISSQMKMEKVNQSQQIKTKLKTELTFNESRFNNYAEFPLQPQKIRDFNKYLSRMENAKATIERETEKAGKIYEKLTFDESYMKCKWKYKLQKGTKQPSYFPKRDKQFNQKEISTQKLDSAKEKATAHWRKIQNQFKYQLPHTQQSQFNRIFDTPQANWRSWLPKKKQEKIKQMKFNQKKTVEFERQDLCDIKFFRIKDCKEKRLAKMTQ